MRGPEIACERITNADRFTKFIIDATLYLSSPPAPPKKAIQNTQEHVFNRNETFSKFSSARVWTSVILKGKPGSRRHSTTDNLASRIEPRAELTMETKLATRKLLRNLIQCISTFLCAHQICPLFADFDTWTWLTRIALKLQHLRTFYKQGQPLELRTRINSVRVWLPSKQIY